MLGALTMQVTTPFRTILRRIVRVFGGYSMTELQQPSARPAALTPPLA